MMGKMTLSYGVAQIIAPAITGWLATRFGSYNAGLYLAAAVMVVGTVLLLVLKPIENATPREAQPSPWEAETAVAASLRRPAGSTLCAGRERHRPQSPGGALRTARAPKRNTSDQRRAGGCGGRSAAKAARHAISENIRP